MWIRVADIGLKQIDANQLENPKNLGTPMVLDLFQRETGTAFWIVKNKKVFTRFLEIPSGKTIPKRKWTDKMKTFAQSEMEKISPQKGRIKVTIFGWLLLLFAFGTLGYVAYEGLQAPGKAAKFQQRMAEASTVHEGDIYMGRIGVYKEKGNSLGMEGGFGFFKVVKINGDTYQIAKSVEMSKTAKPKEQLNSTDFEQETFAVKAKELEAYQKSFVSEDGLVEIYFSEKK
ncbi:hypothetical protein [Sphingobacterium haloxyli]|uniref:Uncharacterized protein n=1 Tax=Sphingobacterium haloxyli TaxID=2100533 RepID=A0A2S9IYC0_9SPHI|nr:hypothetical protein [Sphingobacterium haloxyli]PRD45480.1 hypothetical protein C5745_17980 [Sphingobacterium haloxyli]